MRVHASVCICVCMCMYVLVYVHVYVYVCISLYMCLYVYVCVHLCVLLFAHIDRGQCRVSHGLAWFRYQLLSRMVSYFLPPAFACPCMPAFVNMQAFSGCGPAPACTGMRMHAPAGLFIDVH